MQGWWLRDREIRRNGIGDKEYDGAQRHHILYLSRDLGSRNFLRSLATAVSSWETRIAQLYEYINRVFVARH